MSNSESEVEVLAACAQLLALRASLPEGSKVAREQIRMLPDLQMLTNIGAATVLAGRPKPLRCIPSLRDGSLSVTTEPATTDWARLLAMVSRAEVLDQANAPWVGAGAVILLKGRDESLTLTGPAYRAWRRDYLPPDHSGLGGWPPTDAEAAAGFTYVWQVGRTEPAIEAYSLTADSSVLCERCGTRLATAFFRNRDVDPPLNLLLCAECIDAENGRKLVSVLNDAVAVLLMRDGYAGLRGVHLGVQTKGRSWLFLRGPTGRVAGGAFILLGALFLYFAWIGL